MSFLSPRSGVARRTTGGRIIGGGALASDGTYPELQVSEREPALLILKRNQIAGGASFEELFRQNQRRTEGFLRGGSLGRSLSRSFGGGLYDHRDKTCMREVHETEGKPLSTDDTSRISLRLYSLNYLKKFSSWKIPQSSLSRVLSFRQGKQFSLQYYRTFLRPVQSPTLSDRGSIISGYNYRASSPPEFGRSVSPPCHADSETPAKNSLTKKKYRHRRTKSIGDITVTPV